MTPTGESIAETYRKQAGSDLVSTMATEQGRRLLWELIETRCGSGFAGLKFHGEATHAAAFSEGRRSVGAELMAECQRVAPPDYVRMLSEAVSRREAMRLAENDPTGGSP